MYICIYAYMKYVYMYNMYICTHADMNICIHINVYVYVYRYICICVVNTNPRACVYTCSFRPDQPSPSQCSLLYFSMLPLPLLLFPMEASFLIDGELWAALWQF